MANTKSKSLLDTEGRVGSLSHIFRILEHPLYIIELENKVDSYFILVRRKEQFKWHREITPGSFYKITNLKEDIIYKGTYDINILTTTKQSSILKTKEGDEEFSSSEDIEYNFELVNFQGLITSVVNEEAGIFKLNGDVLLIVSYLKEVTAELGCQSHSDEEKIPNLASSPFCVGDKLSLYQIHAIKGRDGSSTLVCCGRSLIKNERNYPIVYNAGCSSNYSILHCLHIFNFGLSFLYWLCDLESLFLNEIFKDVSPTGKITSRKWERQKGLIWKYLGEILKGYKKESRSLLLEFMLSDHSCVLSQAFDPYNPIKINELLSFEDVNSIEERPINLNSPWRHSVVCGNSHKWVLFGILGISTTGSLFIELNGQCIDVVIVGSKEDLYKKFDRTIAVCKFDFVEEKFDLYEGSFSRKYIIIRSSGIISITENDVNNTECCKLLKTKKESFVNKENTIKNYYELKLKSISNLHYFADDLKQNGVNKFFMANATIVRRDCYGKAEMWDSVVKFKGNFTNLYPFLSEPSVVKGKLYLNKFNDSSFRKRCYFSWMMRFHEQFGTMECTEVPPEFEVTEIVNSCCGATDNIKDILIKRDLTSKYFSVTGKIIQKWFMTPKFESQFVDVPQNLVKEGVGVPGSKLIRLLVQDLDDEGFTIYVYLSTGNQFYLSHYNLGLIPGTIINITWLERSVSQKGSIYLSATPFSNVSILKFDPGKEKEFKTRHHFLLELLSMPSGSVGLLFATVSCILNVTLKTICSSCESDFENGVCTYQGCHANDGCKVGGSTKIILDDGTNTASLFIKDIKLIRTLFLITEKQWKILGEMLDGGQLVYKFQHFKDKRFNNDRDYVFAKLVNNSLVFRPLKITYRIFPNKETTINSSLDLFAIDLINLDPVQDVGLLRNN